MATPTRPRSRPAGLADPPDLVLGLEPIRRRPGATRTARDRMAHRRRRSAALLVLVLAGVLVFVDLLRGAPDRGAGQRGTPAGGSPAPSAAGSPAAGSPAARGPAAPGGRQREALPKAAPPKAAPPKAAPAGPKGGAPDRALAFPVTGPGTFTYAAGTGTVRGTAGTVRRFHVAVENGAGQDAAAFAAAVDRVFADPRSWTAARRWRFQRVPQGVRAEFTIFLATPGTSESMCAAGGLRTERYTNCRLPGKVVINLARWWGSVPGYGAALVEYQTYAINHEVGHQLGFGHERCPKAGAPAPVMQQQTLGLAGCRANGWPYLNGRRYAGPPVA